MLVLFIVFVSSLVCSLLVNSFVYNSQKHKYAISRQIDVAEVRIQYYFKCLLDLFTYYLVFFSIQTLVTGTIVYLFANYATGLRETIGGAMLFGTITLPFIIVTAVVLSLLKNRSHYIFEKPV